MDYYAINIELGKHMPGMVAAESCLDLKPSNSEPAWFITFFNDAQFQDIQLPDEVCFVATKHFGLEENEFIENTDFMRYGLRSFIASEEFLKILKTVNANFKYCKASFFDKKFNKLYKNKFYLVLIGGIVPVLDSGKLNNSADIIIKDGINYDIFQPSDIHAVALFCSSLFRELCEKHNIKNINFTLLSDVVIVPTSPGGDIMNLRKRPPSRESMIAKALEKRHRKQKST